jgi:hypothetical protein
VIDDELAAAVEEGFKIPFSMRAVEDIVLFKRS